MREIAQPEGKLHIIRDDNLINDTVDILEKVIINIPYKYHTKPLETVIEQRFPRKFILNPYNPGDLPQALKDLKRVVNGKNFENTKMLEIKIEEMNQYFANKLRKS